MSNIKKEESMKGEIREELNKLKRNSDKILTGLRNLEEILSNSILMEDRPTDCGNSDMLRESVLGRELQKYNDEFNISIGYIENIRDRLAVDTSLELEKVK